MQDFFIYKITFRKLFKQKRTPKNLMRIVYITAKNAVEAKAVSSHLLEKKLAACTNIFPVESMFWWKGEVQETSEFVILAKTNDDNFGKIETEVKEMIGYDVPAIYSWKADKVSDKYNKWINKETK